MQIDVMNLLTTLGLSESESKVYLAGLKLGPTSVQKLAKEAGFSRTAAYDIVSSLQDKGLISTFEQGRRKLFTAEEPERALLHFKETIRRMEDQFTILEKSLPSLKMMVGGERPVVRFYEGNEAIVAAFHDLQSVDPDTVYEITNMEVIKNVVSPEFLDEVREITQDTSSEFKILYRGELNRVSPRREYRKLPDDWQSFDGDIVLYKDRIVLYTLAGKVNVVIVENQILADMLKMMFTSIWNIAEPFKPSE